MAQVYGVRKHNCKHVMIIIPRSVLIPKATAEVMKQTSRPEEPEPELKPRQEPEEPTTLQDRENEVGKLVDGLDLPDIDGKDDDKDGE
jgi:hypothetical protein